MKYILQISRNKKVEEPESDSDWDSLPGDVPEPSSSPEHKPTAAGTQRPSHSPVPPKQPNAHHISAKHHVTAKPLNIYKNTLNNSQKTVTTFEDKSGGLWDDSDENEHPNIKSHHPKEHDNHGNTAKTSKEKKAKQHVQEQENKRPPFADFKGILSFFQSIVCLFPIFSVSTWLHFFALLFVLRCHSDVVCR